MQKSSLYSLAKIDSGKSFRQKPEFISGGGCALIQMKDVSPDGFEQKPQSIAFDEVNSGQLLKRGDLIFAAKGNNNFAVLYDNDAPATAVSLFFIIRPDRNKVDPGYLAWVINSTSGQKYFEQHRMGASVGNIRKKVLEDFKFELPPIALQQKISQLYLLLKQEKNLTSELLSKRKLFINESIKTLLQ